MPSDATSQMHQLRPPLMADGSMGRLFRVVCPRRRRPLCVDCPVSILFIVALIKVSARPERLCPALSCPILFYPDHFSPVQSSLPDFALPCLDLTCFPLHRTAPHGTTRHHTAARRTTPHTTPHHASTDDTALLLSRFTAPRHDLPVCRCRPESHLSQRLIACVLFPALRWLAPHTVGPNPRMSTCPRPWYLRPWLYHFIAGFAWHIVLAVP